MTNFEMIAITLAYYVISTILAFKIIDENAKRITRASCISMFFVNTVALIKISFTHSLDRVITKIFERIAG